MPAEELRQTSLPDSRSFGIFDVVRVHFVPLIVTFFVGIGLTVLAFSLVPRSFRSSAKLFAKMGRESVVLDPTARSKQAIALTDPLEREVFTVAELLKSRQMAEAVVAKFGAETILAKETGEKFRGDYLAFLDAANLNPLRVYSVEDRAVKHFQEQLGVVAGKKTNVISLWYEAESPEFARDVLEGMIDIALAEHMEMHRTRGSEEFFIEKANLAGAKVDELENAKRELKTKHGFAELVKQRDVLLEMIGQLRLDLLKAQSDEVSVASGLEERRSQLRHLPEMILIQEATDRPMAVGQALREKLYDLELREKELSTRLAPAHIELKRIRAQIAEVRTIAQQEEIAVEKTQGANPLLSLVRSEIMLQEAKLAEIQARVKSLAKNLETAQSELKSLNDFEVKARKLDREIKLAEADYQTYRENLEQAVIGNELEAKKISSLNVIGEPTLVRTPVSPNPRMMMGSGVVLSGLCALAVALLFERRASRRGQLASDAPRYHSSPAASRESKTPRVPLSSNIETANAKESSELTAEGSSRVPR